jgi:hypothetical protein
MGQSEIRNVWEARLTDYLSSGLSASPWCEMNRVSCSLFYYWKRKFMNAASPYSQWVTLQVEPQPIEELGSSLPVKIGPAEIEVIPVFDRNLLCDVLRTLQALY